MVNFCCQELITSSSAVAENEPIVRRCLEWPCS